MTDTMERTETPSTGTEEACATCDGHDARLLDLAAEDEVAAFHVLASAHPVVVTLDGHRARHCRAAAPGEPGEVIIYATRGGAAFLCPGHDHVRTIRHTGTVVIR